MPTENQGMLDNIKITDGALGPVGGLSTSDSARLKSAYYSGPSEDTNNPNGPQFNFNSAPAETIIDGTSAILSRPGYRSYYRSMMKDVTSHGMSGFPSTLGMTYGGSPTLGLTAPEGEPLPGEKGSTIAPSGLGPNVNVTGFDQGEQVMVDASPTGAPPFSGNGSKSPSVTSEKIVMTTSIHGTHVPGESSVEVSGDE